MGSANTWSSGQITVLFRLNEQGDSLWTKTYWRNSLDARWPVKMAAASDGSGFFLLMGNGSGTANYNSVLKVDVNADSVWHTLITGIWPYSPAYQYDIVATPDGGCITAGGGPNGEPTVIKLNAAGVVEWSNNSATGGAYSHFRKVTSGPNNTYFATGIHEIWQPGIENDERILVAKYNGDGTLTWDRTYYSGSLLQEDSSRALGNDVVPTADGGCLVAGYVSDPGFHAGSALLMRLDANGDSLWTRKYFRWPNHDPNQRAEAFRLLAQTSGDFLMYLHQNAGFTSAHATLLKLTANGDTLWSQVGYDYPLRARNLDVDGGVLLSGNTWPGNVGVFVKTTADGMVYAPVPHTPWNGQTNVAIPVEFTWNPTGSVHRVSSYHLQVATDPGFSSLVYENPQIIGTSLLVPQLQQLTIHYWRVRGIGAEGSASMWSEQFNFTTAQTTGLSHQQTGVPLQFHLAQNHPNPFNPVTTIEYTIPVTAPVEIVVFDLQGRQVATPVWGLQTAGEHRIEFDGSGLPSGTYFYTLRTREYSATRKMLLVK